MTDVPATLWKALETLEFPTLAALFAAPDRLDRYATTLDLPGGPIRFDWSKTHLHPAAETILTDLAHAQGFAEKRRQLFDGELINNTEGRAAEHTPNAASARPPVWSKPKRCMNG